jgi:zinc transporter 2
MTEIDKKLKIKLSQRSATTWRNFLIPSESTLTPLALSSTDFKMDKETRLKIAICLSLFFMVIEIAGGYWANSIAIFSDAAHLLTDIAGFAIALIATIAARSPGTKTMTFGMARAEVFGALGSILSLWVITAVLLYAAFVRAIAWFEGKAETVDGFLMFIVACFGILVNLCLGYVFHEDHGGAFHPAHSHDHGHAAHGSDHHDHHDESHSPVHQVTLPSVAVKKTPTTAHDHGHEHGTGKGHSHAHEHSETTPLLPNVGAKYTELPGAIKVEPFAFLKAAKCTGHTHEDGSDHMEESPAKPTNSGKTNTPHGHDHSHAHAGHSHSDHDHLDKDLELGRIAESDLGRSQRASPRARSRADSHSHLHDHAHSSDVNIEAAYLHVLTDLIQSIGVAIAGAVMWWQPTWQIIDPVCTVIFSIVALNSTLPLINRVGLILFEGTPSTVSACCGPYLCPITTYVVTFLNYPVMQVDWEVVMSRFQELPGVEDVHDLHIWSISSDSISLTCHIRVRPV